jgi:hypothetical protein
LTANLKDFSRQVFLRVRHEISPLRARATQSV